MTKGPALSQSLTSEPLSLPVWLVVPRVTTRGGHLAWAGNTQDPGPSEMLGLCSSRPVVSGHLTHGASVFPTCQAASILQFYVSARVISLKQRQLQTPPTLHGSS